MSGRIRFSENEQSFGTLSQESVRAKFDDRMMQQISKLEKRASAMHRERFFRVLDQSMSPIEALVIASLMSCGWQDTWSLGGSHENWGAIFIALPQLSPGNDVLHYGSVSTVFQPPVIVGGRTLHPDFAFIHCHEDAPKILVELDGHDFHERTKEQARRDKKRDRDFVTLGWTMLRFTGSEVWADPSCVLRSVSDVFSKWLLNRRKRK